MFTNDNNIYPTRMRNALYRLSENGTELTRQQLYVQLTNGLNANEVQEYIDIINTVKFISASLGPDKVDEVFSNLINQSNITNKNKQTQTIY